MDWAPGDNFETVNVVGLSPHGLVKFFGKIDNTIYFQSLMDNQIFKMSIDAKPDRYVETTPVFGITEYTKVYMDLLSPTQEKIFMQWMLEN